MNKEGISRVLGEYGPQQKRLVVGLTEYKRHRLLDLRYWFLDSKSTWQRTRKGITLNSRNYLMVRRLLEENHEEVMNWLGVGHVPEHTEQYAVDQEESRKKARFRVGAVDVSSDSRPRDPTFFNVDHKGGREEINYNSAHKFFKHLVALTDGDSYRHGIRHMFDVLLVSYARARQMLEESPSTNPSVLFDTLEYNWSRLLDNYLNAAED